VWFHFFLWGMTFTGHTTLFVCRSFCVVHCFIINLSEISMSFFTFIFCQSPLKSLRTSFTKVTFSFVILNNKFATTDIFFHTCRKHKLYEQYILYYCTYILVEIVLFPPIVISLWILETMGLKKKANYVCQSWFNTNKQYKIYHKNIHCSAQQTSTFLFVSF